MNSVKCNTCGKSVIIGGEFCPGCGTPLKGAKTLPKKVTVKQSENIVFSALLTWLFIALMIGFLVGWIRYWIGYYVLIQGVIAGFLIPWIVKKTAKPQMEALSTIRFKMAVFLFFSFMIGQALGYGVAQPVFDPFNWLARVWNGDTTESVFGIFSTAGVVSQTFSEGLSGGFWLLLSLIDLFFMFFFMLVSMPLMTKKAKS